MPYILRKTVVREEVTVKYLGKTVDNKLEFVISIAGEYFGNARVYNDGIVEYTWREDIYDTDSLIRELQDMAKKIQSNEEK